LTEDLTQYEQNLNKTLSNGNPLYSKILESSTNDENIIIWNYSEIIEKYDLDYMVSRDWYIFHKVSEDPKFEFIYNCGNVSIFQLVK
jgi:hypothetical protein